MKYELLRNEQFLISRHPLEINYLLKDPTELIRKAIRLKFLLILLISMEHPPFFIHLKLHSVRKSFLTRAVRLRKYENTELVLELKRKLDFAGGH